MKQIPFFNTYIDSSASSEVNKVLQSTFLSEGETVKIFEKKLENDLGLVQCVALNSGTSALHLALVQAGVGEGDEVIIPAQTFVATGLVVLYQRATPVFADIDYTTGNILPSSVRNQITSRTKALIVVHWAGYPCDMSELIQIAKENNLVIIEDAAHALGASYKGQPIGAISDYTCFSFQAIKHVTTGDGGALCLLDRETYDRAIINRWFGINRATAELTELGERSYNIAEAGYKYHMNNYSAALGIANLRNFKDRLQHRTDLANLYRTGLEKLAGIQSFASSDDRKSAYWLFGVHVEKRLEFVRALKSRGISTSVVHQRIDRNTVFGNYLRNLPNQAKFDETQIHLPLHDNIDGETVEFIIETIRRGW